MRRQLAALLLAASAAAQAAPALKSGTFAPARPAPEIVQRTADGKDFRLSALRGKVVVLAFGFTHCPAVCPASLAMLAQARRQLGSQADRLQVVFISVDPERDTAGHLAAYLAQFDKSFIGLTGTPAQMAAIRKDFGITATRFADPAGDGGYQMGHSSYLYFIDKKGMLRAMMPFGRPADELVHDVRVLAAE